MAKMVSFKIDGLDCGEEVAALKREVGPLVRKRDRLLFDVLNGNIALLLDRAGPRQEGIVAGVSRAGIQAIPWQAMSSERPKSWKAYLRKPSTNYYQ